MNAKLPSPSEMAAFDKKTIDAGTSSKELMERAGNAAYEEICNRYSHLIDSNKPVTIFSGPGNNGGDGVVIARLLAERGVLVNLIVVESTKYSKDLKTQLNEYSKKWKPIYYPNTPNETVVPGASNSIEDLQKLLNSSCMVIDALLGTGQEFAPRGVIGQLVEPLTISCDTQAYNFN